MMLFLLGATQRIQYNLKFLNWQGGVFMGWRSVIVTQHAKMSYSAGLMVVQTMDGTSEIPLDDMALLM